MYCTILCVSVFGQKNIFGCVTQATLRGDQQYHGHGQQVTAEMTFCRFIQRRANIYWERISRQVYQGQIDLFGQYVFPLTGNESLECLSLVAVLDRNFIMTPKYTYTLFVAHLVSIYLEFDFDWYKQKRFFTTDMPQYSQPKSWQF